MLEDQNKLLYLSMQDAEVADVPMLQIIEALEAMFVEKGNARIEMPSKIGIHTRPNALIHAMPAYIPATGAAGMKWVAAYPENHKFKLPQVSGLIVLNDEETGLPYCLMDCRWVTAKRTGAKTALAARHLARPDSSAIGMVACGVQGRSNLEALACRFDIKRVHAFDIHRPSAEAYAEQMSAQLGLDIQIVETLEEAVREMDIVVTSGPISKVPSPAIELDWLKPGAFAAPVDFDSYWKPEVLHGVDLFATDDVEQFFFYQERGYFQSVPCREKVLDLGDLATGKAQGRQNDSQRTLAMNLGLALDDMAVAPLVYKAAREKGLGTQLGAS